MNLTSNWYPAKLNGVPFFATEVSIPELGRKTAVFEYPNSDSRYVEDMGKIREMYQIEAQVGSNRGTASSYKRNKERFEKALSQKGLSVLIHPTKGRKEVVIASAKELEPTQGSVGIVRFSFIALESDKNKFPTGVSNKKSIINSIYDKLSDKNKQLLNNAVSLFNEGAEIYNQGRDVIQESVNAVQNGLAYANGINDEMAAILGDVNAIKSTINDVLNFPSRFVSSFTNIFNGLLNATTNFDDAFKINETISQTIPKPFNDPLPQNKASNLISISTKVALLSNCYQFSTSIDYTKQQQVDNIILRLENLFNEINPLLLDDETYSLLEDLRTQTLLTLKNLKLKLPFITTITTNQLPAISLAYGYYFTNAGQEYENILNLNNFQDPSSISGNVNLFAQ